MIRRPPTSIGLTADDLAIFEKQYASGEIYAHHRDTNDSAGTQRAPRMDVATPASPRDGANPMAKGANAGEIRESGRGQTQAQLDEEQRQARTRDQRILGTTGNVDAAAVGGITDSGDESGVAGSGTQAVQQRQQQQQQQQPLR